MVKHKIKGVISLIMGFVLIILSIFVYFFLVTYVPDGTFSFYGLIIFMLSSPLNWVALILIVLGIYLLVKKN